MNLEDRVMWSGTSINGHEHPEGGCWVGVVKQIRGRVLTVQPDNPQHGYTHLGMVRQDVDTFTLVP